MPVPYMGTKRHMAGRVVSAVDALAPTARVADLFGGVGAVAAALASRHPVLVNDRLSFASCLSRGRFLPNRRSPVENVREKVRSNYRVHYAATSDSCGDALRREVRALDGELLDLQRFMSEWLHVGNSEECKNQAKLAKSEAESAHYRLAYLYFAAGYFSVRQALQLDALRYAIDKLENVDGDRDWLLSAWIATAASVINSPGHTAQYLRPNESSAARLRRGWRRDVWGLFLDKLADIQLVGDPTWRASNAVTNNDAVELLNRTRYKIGCVYADPPYTKDQYSRYYHVYETLYRYDYPDSVGIGRYRSDRFVTEFSLKTRVEKAFHDLAGAVQARAVPLVLSYPEEGLLQEAGGNLMEILREYFSSVEVSQFQHSHSTLGASKGSQTKAAMEKLYVCT